MAERVRVMIADQLEIEIEKCADGARLRDDLGADSLDPVELVMEFEETFGVEIPDELFEAVQTVGDAIRVVTELAGEGVGA